MAIFDSYFSKRFWRVYDHMLQCMTYNWLTHNKPKTEVFYFTIFLLMTSTEKSQQCFFPEKIESDENLGIQQYHKG